MPMANHKHQHLIHCIQTLALLSFYYLSLISSILIITKIMKRKLYEEKTLYLYIHVSACISIIIVSIINLAALCVGEVTVVCWCVCVCVFKIFSFFTLFFLNMVIATAIKLYMQLVTVVSYHFMF